MSRLSVFMNVCKFIYIIEPSHSDFNSSLLDNISINQSKYLMYISEQLLPPAAWKTIFSCCRVRFLIPVYFLFVIRSTESWSLLDDIEGIVVQLNSLSCCSQSEMVKVACERCEKICFSLALKKKKGFYRLFFYFWIKCKSKGCTVFQAHKHMIGNTIRYIHK